MENLAKLLVNSTKKFSDKNFLCYKKDGAYTGITFKEIFDRVEHLANQLIKLGVAAGDRIGILAYNSPEWVIADLAILACGGVSVPLYFTSAAEQIAYIINDCQIKILFFQAETQTEKLIAVKDKLPTISSYITLDKKIAAADLSAEYIYDLIEGAKVAAKLADLVENIESKSLATIIYTSGTTGNPKGVMLTHANIIANVKAIVEHVELVSSDSALSFLPLAHVFERTAGYYNFLALGGTISYAESIETVAEDIGLTKPTVMISVPRFFEKIRTKVLSQLHGIKKIIFHAALKHGAKHQSSPTFMTKVFDHLVYGKLRKKFGGRIRFFVSGGAPLGKEVGNFFAALGVNLIEGYGMTEASPVIAANNLKHNRIGTVGRTLPGVEVKLANDGELLTKGKNIMQGYYNLPDKTKEAIDSEGWLHTGDIAKIDDDGYISIIDRKKELIIMSNGKNVAPLEVESHLSKSRYINQLIVYGDNKQFLSALIVPAWEQIISDNTKLAQIEHEKLVKSKEVNEIITKALEKRFSALASYQTIKKFILLPEEFSQDNNELTPTLKFKRKIIYAKYGKELEDLYK